MDVQKKTIDRKGTVEGFSFSNMVCPGYNQALTMTTT